MDNPETQPHCKPPKYELAFGAREHVDVICKRLEKAFAHSDKQDPMVVGLFGEWGSGKSLWLEHIGHRFCPFDDKSSDNETTITLPIPFNAWRYEAEEHLIVPLLKTAEQQLKKLAETQPEQNQNEQTSYWRKVAQTLGIAAISIGSGLKGELEIPLLGKASVDIDKILKTERYLKEKYKQTSLSQQAFPDASSIYFNFHDALRQITGRDSEHSETKLNLLFLIDDLDRCLPEKAVQLLESIKLFLDVEGCGFVLALDEEVIERGIAHRYQAYADDDKKSPNSPSSPSSPITGSEYLEKIIHLPVRIPRPREMDIQAFLLEYHPDTFGASKPHDEETEPDQALIKLFREAVPPVPRKLHRAAELLSSKIEVARSRGWHEPNKLILARLTLLELFAPEVYRFARRRKATNLLQTMENWVSESGSKDIKHPAIQEILEKRQTEGEQKQDEGIRYDLENRLKPLYELLCKAAQQRSGFEPLKIVDPENSSDTSRASSYFDLRLIESKVIAPKDDRTSTAPSEPERFFSQLFSTDIQLQKDALQAEQEHLQGQVLDETTIKTLEKLAEQHQAMISVDWLERLAPYLYPKDLDRLVKASNIFARLQTVRNL